MHVLDGDGDGERPRGFRPDELAGSERHQRPETLAAGKGGLLDGFLQSSRAAAGRGKVAGKRRFELGAGGRGKLGERAPVRECRGAAFDCGPG